jgi:hypothetical protein
MLYLTMLSAAQNIAFKGRTISESRTGTDIEGKGRGTFSRTVPEFCWWWLSKTTKNRSKVCMGTFRTHDKGAIARTNLLGCKRIEI